MASFLVAHFRKVKTDSGLANVAGHNSREKIIDRDGGWIENDPAKRPAWLIHPDRIGYNKGHEGKRSDTVIKKRYAAIREAALKRKPQKNAAAAIEAVFSASPGSFKKISEWEKYLRECLEWTQKKFGPDNVLQWNTHFDETTPHLHVLLLPIVRDPDRGNKYSSGDFLGGREGLRAIQSELADSIGKRYGLRRGVEGNKSRHTDQAEWIHQVKIKERVLEAAKKNLKPAELAGIEIAEQIGIQGGAAEDSPLFWKTWKKHLPEYVNHSLGLVQKLKAESTQMRQPSPQQKQQPAPKRTDRNASGISR